MKKFYSVLVALVMMTITVSAQDWKEVNGPTYPYFEDVCMVNKDLGYAVSQYVSFKEEAKAEVYKTTDGGMNWIKLELDIPAKTHLYSVYFSDENTGYLGGAKKTLCKTTDGGSTWSVETLDTLQGDIKDIKFTSAQVGWILDYKSKNSGIFKTTDGGSTWTKTSLTVSKYVYAMDFYNDNYGVAVGADHTEYFYTTDGGTTWNSATGAQFPNPPYTQFYLKSICLVNETVGYGVGWGSTFGLQGTIMAKTIDGGKTWTAMEQNEANKTYCAMNACYFSDENNGLAAGGFNLFGSVIQKTTDGGTTWTILDVPYGFTIKGLAGAGNHVVAVGGNGGVLVSEDMGDTWQSPSNTFCEILYNIQFVSNAVGYATGNNGVFLKTTDGGKTWENGYAKQNNTCAPIKAMTFVNENVGYLARSYGEITKTTDGGKTWTVQREPGFSATEINSAVYFLDENNGYVVGKLGTNQEAFFKTTDGGANWTTPETTFEEELTSVYFHDVNKGVVGGDDLLVAYTTDGGNTWTNGVVNGATDKDSSASFDCLAFADVNVGLASGSKMIFKTTDGGKTWNKIDVTLTSSVNGVYVVDAQTYYFVHKNEIYKTTDGGTTWTNIVEGNATIAQNLNSICLDEKGSIWVAGYYGSIYTNSDLSTAVENISSVVPEDYELTQNYPNPFNPTTKIQYKLAEAGIVKLNVYSVTGELVASLVNTSQKAGTYSVDFNAANLASGVYVYTLSQNQTVMSKKMLLLK